jgi:hypothetical protein
MQSKTTRPHLPAHVAREIAVAAKTDPRSVQRVVSGQSTKAAIRDRILRVLHERAVAARVRGALTTLPNSWLRVAKVNTNLPVFAPQVNSPSPTIRQAACDCATCLTGALPLVGAQHTVDLMPSNTPAPIPAKPSNLMTLAGWFTVLSEERVEVLGYLTSGLLAGLSLGSWLVSRLENVLKLPQGASQVFVTASIVAICLSTIAFALTWKSSVKTARIAKAASDAKEQDLSKAHAAEIEVLSATHATQKAMLEIQHQERLEAVDSRRSGMSNQELIAAVATTERPKGSV